MRFCHAEGLLRIVLEVCLCEFIRVGVDDINCVVVGAYCTVAPETPEFAAHNSPVIEVKRLSQRQGQVCHIICYAYGKGVYRCLCSEVLVHSGYLCGSGIL